MKYIGADKLIAEIEKKKKILVSEYNELAKYEVWRSAIDNKIKINTIVDILSLITSLQQEQPNAPKGKFNFPKFLYARTLDNKTIDISYAPQTMDAIEYARNDFIEQEQPSLPSNLDEAELKYLKSCEYPPANQEEDMMVHEAFKAGAEWHRELMEDEHGKELLYVCQKTAEREHRGGVREGKAQAEKELIPLINRLCEAILFEWKDAADLARKTLIQIKEREEE